MQIVSLKLLNFRNYNHLGITFSSNKNIIYGKNGTGKTNLIESIYVLAFTKSFRGSTDKVLIHKDKNLTKISGVFLDNIKKEYQLIIASDGKMAKIDGKRQFKLSSYISQIPVVLFHPDSLKMIKDSPSFRRDSLNIDIGGFDNQYIHFLNLYDKVLKQRNAYLKVMYTNGNKSVTYLDILTDKLIDYGIEICKIRESYLEGINFTIGDFYNKISGHSMLHLKYLSDFKGKSKEQLRQLFLKSKGKDMLFGNTTIGVHHDDYLFCLGDEVIKDYASQGQQKNAVISYKLAQIAYFKLKKKSVPILILDDLFSELDNEKIENVLNSIDKDIQTFITVTDINKLSESITKNSKIFYCNDGLLREDL